MILALAAKYNKTFAYTFLVLLYFEILLPRYAYTATGIPRPFSSSGVVDSRPPEMSKLTVTHSGKASGALSGKPSDKVHMEKLEGGPSQPEMESFHSSSNDNMVDLFTGNFSYNIPLIDIDGYPLTLGYSSGVGMDEEASWVGLGWNLNPGNISRNLRGLPDDFNGADSITKEFSIKPVRTVGFSTGADLEIIGIPKLPALGANSDSTSIRAGVGASFGVFKNSLRGWGIENSINTSISVGAKGMGTGTAGLSLTSNSAAGVAVNGAISYSMMVQERDAKYGGAGSIGLSGGYNSRLGMHALQLTGSAMLTKQSTGQPTNYPFHGAIISFAYPTFTPGINIPYTSSAITGNFKVGFETKVIHPNFSIGGYETVQYVADEDKVRVLPAYGYLSLEKGIKNDYGVLDFNREKDIPYREKPAVQHIAVPSYTYDLFTMSGEGIGGMFRAYRRDIGFVYDARMTTKDKSSQIGGDLGFGDVFHFGADFNYTRNVSSSGRWSEQNPLANLIVFNSSNKKFESSYFRGPGEKSINRKNDYDAIGGEDVVTARLFQTNSSDPVISTTNALIRYRNSTKLPDVQLSPRNLNIPREKRAQVISYLSAGEAGTVGLSKYIESYKPNTIDQELCLPEISKEPDGSTHGLLGTYFKDSELKNFWFTRVDSALNFSKSHNKNEFDYDGRFKLANKSTYFSVRWTGFVKAPVNGRYIFRTNPDDGISVKINDTLFSRSWAPHNIFYTYDTLYLEAGKNYSVTIEYNQIKGPCAMMLTWKYGDLTNFQDIPPSALSPYPPKDFIESGNVRKELRVNSFRKSHHISEITVLNPNGQRYVYGVPVYNLSQKEVSFNVDKSRSNLEEGLVAYNAGSDDSKENAINNQFYTGERMPAYAHNFLLSGILSPDYVDVTGDGITSDDPGTAIKFNYSKVAGIDNPFKWRVPYSDSATYDAGLRTDYRDDKGSYIYGEKELWYLHSIESKKMVAIFYLDSGSRKDLLQIDTLGRKTYGNARKLDSIQLFMKADLRKNGVNAIPIKTVHFGYTYELCKGINDRNALTNDSSNGKLTLKKLWFTFNGSNKGAKHPYKFSYNNNNPTYSPKSNDRWGTYKSPLDNPKSSAGHVITNAEYPYSVQDSAKAAFNAAAWTLDSIVTPTGAKMKITYESDDYAYVQHKRTMQMFTIAGFASSVPTSVDSLSPNLYDSGRDNFYVGIEVPFPISTVSDITNRYLEGITDIGFKVYVIMPSDAFGAGGEYVQGYAKIAAGPGNCGRIDDTHIWIKLTTIDKNGNDGGVYSPIAKTALQFLRLNLPSKGYPGSDNNDNPNFGELLKTLAVTITNVSEMFTSFDEKARAKGWAQQVDPTRSYIRLNNPTFNKYGGGLRVKRIMVHDNWNAMTQQKESDYGQEYEYKTTIRINNRDVQISSGVAAYEPILGGEENPFHLPIYYKEQIAVLAPVTAGYTEEPLGEAFFPAPVVGYSRVRVRAINSPKARSTNGFSESCFYTAFDYPTITDRSNIDNDTKKRFKPGLGNFLRINARHYLAVSQGFKVEINDMHGKLKSTSTYKNGSDAPGDWVTNTTYYYKVDDENASQQHLSNVVSTVDNQGNIDTQSIVGEDIELMCDMREERSVTNSTNIPFNSEFFSFGFPPFFLLPTLFKMSQHEETMFRTVALTKVISRHGILDRIEAFDKGSKVTTRNMLFDAETGEACLTSTQNEFDDPVYNFGYPAGWVYDGMSGAYKNINAVLSHLTLQNGHITGGFPEGESIGDYFVGGDELLVYAYSAVGNLQGCTPDVATFPGSTKIYAVDVAQLRGTGNGDIYFLDANGQPYSGNNVTLKVIRSGRRNLATIAGEVTMLSSPIKADTNRSLHIVIDSSSKVITANASEFRQNWKVVDRNRPIAVVPIFGNDSLTRSYSANCPGGRAVPVHVSLKPDLFFAGTKDSANMLALQQLNVDGPTYANSVGICEYGNDSQTGIFHKSDCPGGNSGVDYPYSIAANTYYAPTKDSANIIALQLLQSEGQYNANLYGTCLETVGNDSMTQYFTRNNCGPNYIGSSVPYTVNANTYFAPTKDSANRLALSDINANGLTNANTMGSCDYSGSLYGKLNYAPLRVENLGGNPTIINRYTDVSISFFSDQAGTIPVSVVNKTVKILVTKTVTVDGNESNPTVTTSTETFVVTGSTVMIMANRLWDKTVAPASGSGVNAVTTAYSFSITGLLLPVTRLERRNNIVPILLDSSEVILASFTK
ncbi:PA14 domain-containing protein [Chitinophaga dinghuensis]|uniref:PA14 domain-containing protein n=2 Tax=Chitinophaga dinghuensis TaxID=1539050 RepID=A0A327VQ58_9BACT|nr:PA14 domain-containing protein [Chitinophaga dinghuensis]